MVCLWSAWGSLFLLPRFLIRLGSHSVLLSFAPPSVRLAVSCFLCYFSLGYILHVVLGPAFPRFDRLGLHGLFFSFSSCVGLVGSPSFSLLSHSVRGSPSSFCHSWSSLNLPSFALFCLSRISGSLRDGVLPLGRVHSILGLFRQKTYLQNKKHTLTCQGGDWLLQI